MPMAAAVPATVRMARMRNVTVISYSYFVRFVWYCWNLADADVAVISSFGECVGADFKFLFGLQAAGEERARDCNHSDADQPAQDSVGHEVPDAGDQHVEQGHGEDELPCEVHELVHAQA